MGLRGEAWREGRTSQAWNRTGRGREVRTSSGTERMNGEGALGVDDGMTQDERMRLAHVQEDNESAEKGLTVTVLKETFHPPTGPPE